MRKIRAAVVGYGKKAFQGKVKLGLEHMVNSCATFYDPARIYPAAIEVNIK